MTSTNGTTKYQVLSRNDHNILKQSCKCYLFKIPKRFAAFACQSGAGAEKAFAKLTKCIGINDLEHKAVFIDPKSKPNAKNDGMIEKFCDSLMGQ